MKNSSPIGVCIGRFQVPSLSDGHRELIDEVRDRHDKLIIFIGIHPFPATKSCPLDFATRALMVSEAYPEAMVLPIRDVPSDKVWSETLDSGIRLVAPFGDATLYGSRDSFVNHYHGKFPTCILEPSAECSGTVIREKIHRRVLTNEDQRYGAIHLAGNQYPKTFMTVDIAIFDENRTKLLLGHKEPNFDETNGHKLWQFIGGFVEGKRHGDLESAARAEIMEETGLETTDPRYVGSTIIKDWRTSDNEMIMTALFVCDRTFGSAHAGDDMNEVRWFNVSDLREKGAYHMISPMHHKLFTMALNEA